MAQEIEYKFLVANDDWKSQQVGPAQRLTQGFLAFGDQTSPTVRIRMAELVEANPASEPEAFLTVKGWGEIAREEVETKIDIQAAREMLAMCQGRIIQKVRHFVREKHGNVFEVDVFEGDFAGLVVAEVELPSEDAVFDRAASFLGADVSRDSSYKNAVMARDGLPRSRSFGPR